MKSQIPSFPPKFHAQQYKTICQYHLTLIFHHTWLAGLTRESFTRTLFLFKVLTKSKMLWVGGCKSCFSSCYSSRFNNFYDLFCFNKVYLSVQFGFVFQVQVKEKSIVCARTYSNFVKHEEKPSHTFTLVWRKYFFSLIFFNLLSSETS